MNSKKLKLLALFGIVGLSAASSLFFISKSKTRVTKERTSSLVCETRIEANYYKGNVQDLGQVSTYSGASIASESFLGKPTILVFMFNLCGTDCPAFARWRYYSNLKKELNHAINVVAVIQDEISKQEFDQYFSSEDMVINSPSLIEKMGLDRSCDYIFNTKGILMSIEYAEWYSWQDIGLLVRSVLEGKTFTPQEDIGTIILEDKAGTPYSLYDIASPNGLTLFWNLSQGCEPCLVVPDAIKELDKRFGQFITNIVVTETGFGSFEQIASYYKHLGLEIPQFYPSTNEEYGSLSQEKQTLADYYFQETGAATYFLKTSGLILDKANFSSSPAVLIFKDGKMNPIQLSCGNGWSKDGESESMIFAFIDKLLK